MALCYEAFGRAVRRSGMNRLPSLRAIALVRATGMIAPASTLAFERPCSESAPDSAVHAIADGSSPAAIKLIREAIACGEDSGDSDLPVDGLATVVAEARASVAGNDLSHARSLLGRILGCESKRRSLAEKVAGLMRKHPDPQLRRLDSRRRLRKRCFRFLARAPLDAATAPKDSGTAPNIPNTSGGRIEGPHRKSLEDRTGRCQTRWHGRS